MPTPKITTVFSRYNDDGFHSKAIVILESLQNNAYFPNPPGLAEVQAATENFRIALGKAINGGKAEIAEKKKVRKLLQDQLRQLGNYITLTANADEAMLVSSGFDLIKEFTPRPAIDAPQELITRHGVNSGEMIVKIKADRRASGYSHEYTPEPLTADSVWVLVQTTKSKHVFKGLEPGKKYRFRSAMIAPRNQKVYSIEIARIAA